MNKKIIASKSFASNISIELAIQFNINNFKYSYTVLDAYYAVRKKPGPPKEGEPETLIYRTAGTKKFVNVLGKKEVDVEGENGTFKQLWYFIEFQSDFVDFENRKIERAASKGWIVGDGIVIVASWKVFRNRLSALERTLGTLTLNEKISSIRQLTHKTNLPFDGVIGRPLPTEENYIYTQEGLPGSNYIESIPYTKNGTFEVSLSSAYEDYDNIVDTGFQLFRDITEVKLSNGETIDLQHVFVGLDVLNNIIHHRTFRYKIWGIFFKTIDVGDNVNSALWAGDLGAGVVDNLGEVDRGEAFSFENVWERFFRISNGGKIPTKNEKEKPFRKHYYLTRASDVDLLSDIYAFYLNSIKLNCTAEDTLTQVFEEFDKKINLDRTKAFIDFFTFLGRDGNGNKIIDSNGNQLFNIEDSFKTSYHFNYARDQIITFALLWEYYRFGDTWGVSDDEISDLCYLYAQNFIFWLEKQRSKKTLK